MRDSESKLLIVANEAIRERTQGFLGHVSSLSLLPFLSLHSFCCYFLDILIEPTMQVGQLRDQIVLDCEADKPYSYRR